VGARRKFLCTLALVVGSTAGLASPLNFKLLSLVPSGAGIVAGFENYPDPHRHGQLLLSTHSNRVDLDDWLAITGVDSKRRFDEGIEIASPPQRGGLLTEHLLLVAGQFDREHIYSAAELNGAERTEFGGETVMLVRPFTREQDEMQEVRWLVILENRIGVLGTPFLVKQVLQRYQTHSDVDPRLKEQLAQLPNDVSSWNVLLSPPTGSTKFYVHTGSRWAGLVDDAGLLLVGARFGPKVRVDFLLHAGGSRGQDFFRRKAASFMQVFADVLPRSREERGMTNVSLEADSVRGSIEMSKQQFELWGEQGTVDRGQQPARPVSHGE